MWCVKLWTDLLYVRKLLDGCMYENTTLQLLGFLPRAPASRKKGEGRGGGEPTHPATPIWNHIKHTYAYLFGMDVYVYYSSLQVATWTRFV